MEDNMEILSFDYTFSPKFKKVKSNFIFYCFKKIKIPIELTDIIDNYILTFNDLKEYILLYTIKIGTYKNYNNRGMISSVNELNCCNHINSEFKTCSRERKIIPSEDVHFVSEKCETTSSSCLNDMVYVEYLITLIINKFYYYHNDKNINLYILNQPFVCNQFTTNDLFFPLITRYNYLIYQPTI